jgi:hypothetical protein
VASPSPPWSSQLLSLLVALGTPTYHRLRSFRATSDPAAHQVRENHTLGLGRTVAPRPERDHAGLPTLHCRCGVRVSKRDLNARRPRMWLLHGNVPNSLVSRSRSHQRHVSVLRGLRCLGALASLACLLTLPSYAHADIYWSYAFCCGHTPISRIGRADDNGTKIDRDLIDHTGPNTGFGIVVVGRYIYWTNGGAPGRGGWIGRASLNGKESTPHFIEVGSLPVGLTADGDHLFWTTQQAKIGRANLNGTDVRPNFISTRAGVFELVAHGNYIYWTVNGAGGSIGRASISGRSVRQQFVTGVRYPQYIAATSRYIYWTSEIGTLGRANADGGDVSLQFIPLGEADLGGITTHGPYLYWSVYDHRVGSVARAKLDGSDVDLEFVRDVSPDVIAVTNGG